MSEFVTTKSVHSHWITPKQPNYIRIRYQSATEEWVAVKDISRSELKAIGEAWTKELMERGKNDGTN